LKMSRDNELQRLGDEVIEKRVPEMFKGLNIKPSILQRKKLRVLARVGSRRKKDFINMHASDFSLILALAWCNICALYVCFIHISCLFANN